MRTTIQLDDHLLSTIEQYARETGQTLTTMVEDALREILAATPQERWAQACQADYGKW